MTDPVIPKVAQNGVSLVIWTRQQPLGASWSQSDTAETTSGHYQYPFQNPILVCKYLSPLISHRNGSVFKIYIWISVFRRKKQFRNLFLGSRDIIHIQKVHFFGDALVSEPTLLNHTKSYNISRIALLEHLFLSIIFGLPEAT